MLEYMVHTHCVCKGTAHTRGGDLHVPQITAEKPLPSSAFVLPAQLTETTLRASTFTERVIRLIITIISTPSFNEDSQGTEVMKK